MAGKRNKLVGKKVKVVFADSQTSNPDGIGTRDNVILLGYDSRFVHIKHPNGLEEFIPLSRIVRIKEVKEVKNG